MSHVHTKKIGLTVILNLIITIVEYAGGIMSGSIALLSDAGHNLSDTFSLILGYFGEKTSEKKPDKKYTFGLQRFEVFTAFINAIILVIIAFYILFELVQRFYEPKQISLGLMLSVSSIGLAGNLVSILILNRDKNISVNMKSAYLHLFYDTVSSVFVIAGAVLIYFTKYAFIDIIAGTIIALMILYSSFDIIKTCIYIFMQRIPDGIEFDEVFNSIKKITGVKSIHNLHIWAINSRDIFLSCHICLSKNAPKTDKLIKTINKFLREKYDIGHTAIQIEKNDLSRHSKSYCS